MVVTLPAGGTIAVGFLHNLYTFKDQRVLVLEKLPLMLSLMGDGYPGDIHARYIGGDFNVAPPPPPASKGNNRIGYAYLYSMPLVAMPAPPPPAPPPPPAFVPNGTTWAGNLYDYWFSTLDPAAPGAPGPGLQAALTAEVIPYTLDCASTVANQMSDHCAIVLQI